jgi:hypothetical protein
MKLNIIQKQVHRNILFIILIIIFFVLGMLTRSAYADEPKGKKISSEPIPLRPEFKPSVLITTTTTSTTPTTTTKPVVLYKKPAKTTSTTTVPTPETNVPPVTQAPAITGDWVAQCHTWLYAAGIPEADHAKAIYLIDRESDCNPNAQNRSSTAYGIAQFLDSTWKGVGCIKTPEPVEQLRCMNKYVLGRYGSWSGAISHSKSTGWY